MREFEKEWIKQVEDHRINSFLTTTKSSNFYKLYAAFKKDRPIRMLRDSRAADQKRWWWER